MALDLTNPFRRRPARLARLPRVVRLYILNTLIGFALSGCFTGAILYFNTAIIAHLVMNVSGGWLAALVFFVLNGIVFAGVQSAIVIMSIGTDDPSGARRAPRPPLASPQPVPMKAPAKRG